MATLSWTALGAATTLIVFCVVGSSSLAGPIDPKLEAVLDAAGDGEEIEVIVRFQKRVNVQNFRSSNRHVRRYRMLKALRSRTAASLDVERLLERRGRGRSKAKRLWLIEGLALKAPADVIRAVALRPRVDRISLDEKLNAPLGGDGSPGLAEWNIEAVGAPPLWDLGHTGSGVVVASMDTGADAEHPDLANNWRGGVGGWYDPYNQRATPYDGHGHGTQTLGIMVGGSAGGTAIGIAPDAEWIAARIFDNSNQASFSAIHLAFQWLIDPDGNAFTDDAPDLVNVSWGMDDYPGYCMLDFEDDVDALVQAGIEVIFAAGNSGPGVGTSVSPANYVGSFSVGSVNDQEVVATSSSRGSSACNGGIFPSVMAPGVDILTAHVDLGVMPPYAWVSGTSFAAPHATGLVAVLMSTFPAISSSEVMSALKATAVDLGSAGPDNDYGAGMLDAVAAYDWLIEGGQCPSGETDSDGDGLVDSCDNCTLAMNAAQRDTDGDGFGNACDMDLNNDGITNFSDVADFIVQFGTIGPDADFNGDGIVNFGDVALLQIGFGLPPGP